MKDSISFAYSAYSSSFICKWPGGKGSFLGGMKRWFFHGIRRGDFYKNRSYPLFPAGLCGIRASRVKKGFSQLISPASPPLPPGPR